MIEIINFFANILSYVISPIYNFVGNYGIAVILFTVIVKILLIPLGVKQQKTTVKTKVIPDIFIMFLTLVLTVVFDLVVAIIVGLILHFGIIIIKKIIKK